MRFFEYKCGSPRVVFPVHKPDGGLGGFSLYVLVLSASSRLRGKRAHAGQTGDLDVLRPCGDRRVSRRAQSCPTRLACPALRSPGPRPRPRTRLRMAPLAEFVASGASPASRPFAGRQAPAARIRESPRRALSPRSRLRALRGLRGACDAPHPARLAPLGTKPPRPLPHTPFLHASPTSASGVVGEAEDAAPCHSTPDDVVSAFPFFSNKMPRGDWRTRALCGNRCDFGCHGNRRVLCARAKIMSGGSPANEMRRRAELGGEVAKQRRQARASARGRASRSRAAHMPQRRDI